MFALNKYLEKLYEIKWKFSADKQKNLEELLFVEFQQKENGYFVINKIIYTAIDILLGLEELDLVITKVKNEIILELV